MSIEDKFDIPLIAGMALREKQIQQNYRPIIAVHKWFARRPGTLFRGLVLAEFGDRPLAESFFKANDFPGRTVADPFMGGGTPLLEANRVGCDVLGFDINPMAAWIVREEMEHLDQKAYRKATSDLMDVLKQEIGGLYRTDCSLYGDRDVPVKYFLWIKTLPCGRCGHEIDLFPGYMIADDTRHPTHVVVCASCGELNEVSDPKHRGKCRNCPARLNDRGPARRNRCPCPRCGHDNAYPRPEYGPPQHRMFAIEYYNPHRKDRHRGRFFKKPDVHDLARYAAAAERWRAEEPRFVPEHEILPGDETDRLHRWGYRRYRDLFNDRQLLGLEVSARWIAAVQDERVRHALATNLSDLLRYQNMLCRYDTMALKSLDIFSVHGFPVGLMRCESNLLGVSKGSGSPIGSGGWTNIVDKYAKAKSYCDSPFEVRIGNGKSAVRIKGEWIGECREGARPREVTIRCTSSTELHLKPESLDAVFTDPPYFGNVQYGELMEFCYAWLRRLVGNEAEGFNRESTRSPAELTGNETQARGLDHFTDGLSAVYREMAHALKPGAPLAFTFHHNRIDVYYAVGVAVLDAGFTCSATLPCPAEMGGSIHIHGTGSSIVDTVFVCRIHGCTRRSRIFNGLDRLVEIVREELAQLRSAGMKPTSGDIRCIVFGHLTRMTIWRLRKGWIPDLPATERLARFARAAADLGDPQAAIDALASPDPRAMPKTALPLFASDLAE
ncbi:MAG: DUF1156 domain-containing protein [Gammaproteobacteria bacterium]